MAATEPKLEDAVKAGDAPLTLTVADILNSKPALNRLAACPWRTDMMVRVYKVLSVLEPIEKAIEKRQREVLLKYAEETEVGQWMFKGETPDEQIESRKKHGWEWADVLKETHALEITPIKFAELKAAAVGDLSLTAGELRALKWLIIEVG